MSKQTKFLYQKLPSRLFLSQNPKGHQLIVGKIVPKGVPTKLLKVGCAITTNASNPTVRNVYIGFLKNIEIMLLDCPKNVI